jgi:P-type Mg2+ transporter
VFIEGAKRLAAHGENARGARRRRAVALDNLAHLRGPLVLLLAARVVSALMGDATSAFVIATLVLASVTLDFVLERRAGTAAEHPLMTRLLE